jgi:hypothetical protein
MSMLEVAITAFEQVVGYEGGKTVVEGTHILPAFGEPEPVMAAAAVGEAAGD